MAAIESSRAMTESFPKLDQSITALYKKLVSDSTATSSSILSSSEATSSSAVSSSAQFDSPSKLLHSSSSYAGLYSMSDFDEVGLSISDFEFIREAGNTVAKGRIAIANSYAHAFFIDRKDMKEANLFSTWQSQLEGTVESLHQRVQASILDDLVNGNVESFMAALDGRDPAEASVESGSTKLTRPKSAPTLSSSSLPVSNTASLFATVGAGGISGSLSSRSPSTALDSQATRTTRSAFKEYRVRILTARSTAETFMKSICAGVAAGVLEGYEHHHSSSSSSVTLKGGVGGNGGGGGGGGFGGRRGVARPHEDTEEEKQKNRERTARYKQMDLDEQLALDLQAEEDGGGAAVGLRDDALDE